MTVLDAYRIGDGGKILAGVMKVIVSMMRFCFAGIGVFGIFRVLVITKYSWSTAIGGRHLTLFIIKLILVAMVFVFGILFYLKAVRWIKMEEASEKGEKPFRKNKI